tara:strand:+ start:3885 stop:4529 length:645 start_codon:yes stop_codon:yes gene_type:complete
MKVLELFAGSRSFSKVAEQYGWKTYTTDYEDFENIDQVCDIFDFSSYKMARDFGIPDVIWASPPCTTFSVASIGHHWKGGNQAYIPKTEQAETGIKIVHRMWTIIRIAKLLNPKLVYIIENPRGLLRKLDIIPHKPNTAWYCQYGDDRAKPTDLWVNFDFTPKKCKNGNPDCHHQPAPRGSRTGTQGLKNAYERSKVPADLCKEIIKTIIKEKR